MNPVHPTRKGACECPCGCRVGTKGCVRCFMGDHFHPAQRPESEPPQPCAGYAHGPHEWVDGRGRQRCKGQ